MRDLLRHHPIFVTTAEVADPRLGPTALFVLASDVAWDAVLSAVQG